MKSEDTKTFNARESISEASGIISVILGVIVLIGWTANIEAFKRILPGFVTMKINTAICFIGVGISLWCLQTKRINTRYKKIATFTSAIVALIGMLTIAEYVLGIDLHIDQIIIPESGPIVYNVYPGRMAFNTAINFVLMSSIFFLYNFRKTYNSLLIKGIITFIGLNGFFAILGYILNIKVFYSIVAFADMALHTATTFIVLSTGIFLLIPQDQVEKSKVEKRTIFGFLGALFFIFLIAIVSIQSNVKLLDSHKWANHTYEVIQKVDEIFVLLKESETDERGYLISGEASFRKSYKNRILELYKTLQSVKNLTRDNTIQQSNFNSLEDLLQRKIELTNNAFSSQLHNFSLTHSLKSESTERDSVTAAVYAYLLKIKDIEFSLLTQRDKTEKENSKYAMLLLQLVVFSLFIFLFVIYSIISRDIAGRKQAEEKFSKIFHFNPSGIIITRYHDGKVIDANDAYTKLTGFTREEMINNTGPQLNMYTPETRFKVLKQLKNNERLHNVDLIITRKDGQPKDVLFSLEKIKINGETCILSVGLDITERKRAEANVRFFASALQKMADAVITLDSSYTIISWNKGAETIYEWSEVEALGKKYYEFLDTAVLTTSETNDTEEVFNRDNWQEEAIQRTKTGKKINVLGVCTVLWDSKDMISGYIVVNHNITLRKQFEDELSALNQSLMQRETLLVEANKELEAFSYSVSHDLRAPLRHISGFIDLFKKGVTQKLTPTEERYLNTITDSATQMGKLIDSLLAFSRFGRSEMKKEKVDVNALVNDVVSEIQRGDDIKKAQIQIQQFPNVLADRSLLRLVFVNLISNGVKYSSKKEHPVISVSCTENNTEYIFSVSDNGAGFNMKYADKLFGVFQRLHRTSEFEGIGIGLATVRRIISRHGGTTRAEGELDKGASFYFTIPKI